MGYIMAMPAEQARQAEQVSSAGGVSVPDVEIPPSATTTGLPVTVLADEIVVAPLHSYSYVETSTCPDTQLVPCSNECGAGSMFRPDIWSCVIWPGGTTVDNNVCITAGIGAVPRSTRLCCPAADPDTCTETADSTIDLSTPKLEPEPGPEPELDWQTLALAFLAVAACCCICSAVAWSHITYKSCEARPSTDGPTGASRVSAAADEKLSAGIGSRFDDEFDSLLDIPEAPASTKLAHVPPPTRVPPPLRGLSRIPPTTRSPMGSARDGTPPRSSSLSRTPPRVSTPPRNRSAPPRSSTPNRGGATRSPKLHL